MSEAVEEVVDLDSMSDDEALAYIDNALSTAEPEPEVVREEVEVDPEVAQMVEDTEPSEDEELETEEEVAEDGTEEPSEEGTDPDVEEEEEDSESTAEEPQEIDAKAIFEPFTANGKTMQVDTAEEALSLMKMGANYYKKMAEIKPSLRLTKMLENNSIDEAKLNYLIDLSNKSPEAIKQLLKDSDTDVDNLDLDEPTQYQPTDHTVSDNDVALDTVLSSIENTDTFKSTINTITKEWDEASRQIILDHPHIISDINAHKANGIFDKIDQAVTKAKVLQQTPRGINSDIDLYQYYGDQLQAAGAFEPPQTATEKTTASASQAKLEAKANATMKRKQAAAPAKSKASTSTKAQTIDTDQMSDEKFAEYFNQLLNKT